MSESEIRIRMYNTGFGDCFLLTFPAEERPLNVLIDCGKHALSTTGPRIGRVVKKVLEDIQERDGPRIDVVVATHRHQDHVSGFSSTEWREVRVGEVWMPWTEHPTDPLAREICDRQSKRAMRLQAGIRKLGLAAADAEYMLSYAGNNLTNAAAMKLLHEGFQGRPIRRFLPDKSEEKNQFSLPALPGLEVYVLGPSRDPDVLAEMDPPGAESFFRSWEIGATAPENVARPFHDRWCLDRAAFGALYGLEPNAVPLNDAFPEASESKLAQIFEEPAMELAARIEQAVNSTSLILLFHFGDEWLLFPGDAQWGSWKGILSNPNHARLLENLSFYKVGHHGSHNATPRSFVERFMNEKVRAMLPYGTVAKWPSIPRQGLLTRLKQKKVLFARSDATPADAGVFEWTTENGEVLYIDTVIPANGIGSSTPRKPRRKKAVRA
jgi:beta-lactamase superfamily II metal-dependent hydrolase